MKKLVLGILAHVDAGKTTLSEAMLYTSGQLRKLGRVDHQDSFLDTDNIEKERGITIFSKQAILPLGDMEITMLDTPGHVDFSAEMERTLSVIDYALLVVSGTEGVQGHTRTVWSLLKRYNIPTFIFVNKMDLPGSDRGAIMNMLHSLLDGGCTDISAQEGEFYEQTALCSEEALSEYLETGKISDGTLRELVMERKLFPVCFGSALKVQGVDFLISSLMRYTAVPEYSDEFGARVYKIARDGQGTRLTYLKVTGGILRVKDQLKEGEKADQIRIYSGSRYTLAEYAEAGTVCAVTGLSSTSAGEGLGIEKENQPPVLEPVLSYRAVLPNGCDPHSALIKLRQLEEEDPQLHVVWNEDLRQIHVQLMGEIQLEVMERIIYDRFGLEIHFDDGEIVYRETITNTVEGVGHFEPLRHYAEVHLLLEPGRRGSGLVFRSGCSEDDVDRNLQHLVLTHLAEKTHLGVLTGSPITDMKITLMSGKASLSHTEGGDFREATYRAVRQGLMQADSILLEPWFDFVLQVPQNCVGRAISDLSRMSGNISAPETEGEWAVITGSAPVSEMQGYLRQVTAYTRGLGRLSCVMSGYKQCHNQEEVIERIGYDVSRDKANTPDSIFCSHGAGYNVRWDMVPQKMHLDSVLAPQRKAAPEVKNPEPVRPAVSEAADKELRAIFERTYGEIKQKDILTKDQRKRYEKPQTPDEKLEIKKINREPEILLVDGYNIIFSWDELKKVSEESLDAARKILMDMLSNYQGLMKNEIILVFDAYKVQGGKGSVTMYNNIHVVYTREAETADTYIECTSCRLSRDHRVRVATSDGPEQLIIMGNGALRMSSRELHDSVMEADALMKEIIARSNVQERSRPVEKAMEKARNVSSETDKKEKRP